MCVFSYPPVPICIDTIRTTSFIDFKNCLIILGIGRYICIIFIDLITHFRKRSETSKRWKILFVRVLCMTVWFGSIRFWHNYLLRCNIHFSEIWLTFHLRFEQHSFWWEGVDTVDIEANTFMNTRCSGIKCNSVCGFWGFVSVLWLFQKFVVWCMVSRWIG